MRHIIAILLQNEAGALSRVAGLFSTRGYNIESLSVAPTDDPTVSRLTLVTTGSPLGIGPAARPVPAGLPAGGPRNRADRAGPGGVGGPPRRGLRRRRVPVRLS